jgi:hypothetical protein
MSRGHHAGLLLEGRIGAMRTGLGECRAPRIAAAQRGGSYAVVAARRAGRAGQVL